MSRIAVIQRPPVLLDRERALQVAVAAVTEAAQGGAKLIVFPEAFVPGYPVWIWPLKPGADMGLATKLHALLLDNAVSIKRGDLAPLCGAAREHDVTVVCGMHERDEDFSRGTLYNTAVVIGPDGAIRNRHRKLMPTSPERMMWGLGDAPGLQVVDTPCGRVGTPLYWESHMPLARYALYAQGVEIYVAPTYDAGEGWIGTMQHVAREGGCWVVGAGLAMKAADIPEAFPERSRLYPDPEESINPGDSVVVAPWGKIEAGPLSKQTGILYAEIDTARCGAAQPRRRRSLRAARRLRAARERAAAATGRFRLTPGRLSLRSDLSRRWKRISPTSPASSSSRSRRCSCSPRSAR
jgi:nitrilase